MRQSIVKRKLTAGEQVLVAKVCFLDPSIVEMLGLLGFDCLWICNEYRAINPQTLENMIRAGRAAGADCVIRTGPESFDDFARILAMGADGLMVPHLQSAQHARRVVERTKFPPLGRRALESINADADFGLMPLDKYMTRANEETFLVLQIEDGEALEQVEEIAAVAGIDVLFVGAGDLSVSLGVPGQVKHPRVLEAVRRAVRACEGRGIACGTSAIDPEHCRVLLDEGVRYFADGSDWRILLAGVRQHKQAFGELGFTFREDSARA